MKPKFLAFPLALAFSQSALAADFTWKGTTDSTWGTGTNWLAGVAPTYGADLTADRLVIGNGANPGAVYNPVAGPGDTTIFGSGRGILIGSSTQGPASLTVSSGTLKINGTGADAPIMANGVSASVLINGGNLDLTGNAYAFRFFGSAALGLTSDLTITSGSFSTKGFDLLTAAAIAPTAGGTGTVNLDGGSLAVTAFTRTSNSTTTTSILNLNGGTLSIRTASSASFLPALPGLQTIVKAGGAVIDSSTFDMTIAEVLEHDTTLGVSPDGGLTKNGAGTLVLTGANTFDGGLTINAGTNLTPNFNRVTLDNDSAAGAGTITLADSFAELRLFGTTGRSIANPIVVSNTGAEKSLIFTQAGTATCSGPITINETNIDHFRVRADSTNLNLTGKISGAGGINRYQGSFVVELGNSANDFTGGAKLTVGTLGFSAGALGTSGTIIMDGGNLRWAAANDEDISSRLLMVDGKAATFNLLEQTTPSYDVANVTFASAIGNGSTASLVKIGAGTLTLTQPSTYSGGTTVSLGTLDFANGGLGTTGAITMNGGILRWGTGNTEDISSRIVMVDAKNASFSTNGNNVTFASAIGNSSTGNFFKTGTGGTLTLTSPGTYTGTTTLGGGTLALGADNVIPETPITIGAATLDAATFDDQLGTLDVSAAATINLGAGANLIFADSNLVDWTGGTLNITGTFVSGSSIKFATSGGLTLTQLGLITINGVAGSYTLDGSGFLTSGAVSGFAAWQAANSTAGGLNLDHDNDGVSNGLEWFLGGNTNTTGFTSLPGVTNTAGTLSVTWVRHPDFPGFPGNYGTDVVVETSSTLAAPWTAATTGVGADKVEITGDSVKYTFATGTRNFARLKITDL